MRVVQYYMANDMLLPADKIVGNDFEQQYIRLRQQEGRLYSDEEVAMLPEVLETNRHKQEWRLRKKSAERLINYLRKKNKPLKILEVGCGNGWLSHQLSKVDNTTVVGLDINFTELQQATRVFEAQPNLSFFYGSLQSPVLHTTQFDIIVFAASLQYFPSLTEIINTALLHLKRDGELHILDTPFYTNDEVSFARQRSQSYFNDIGFPEMIHYYFHHSLKSLKAYHYECLYNPHSITNKFYKNKSPFYWIRIKA